ncbi:MAG: glycosyltransferase family A protein, partial [Rhodothermales bacterium]
MSEPRLSVIIPVYNAERYVAEAIRSVLDQDYVDLEIVVVDDGSTDGSASVAQQFKEIRLIRQENQGPGAGLNTGILNARGDLIAFLDADDKW